jgi:primosomal protein N' (replication factor Y)
VLHCAACGWKSACPHCSAWRVFHKGDRTLRCHHCGFTERVPRACPECGNLDIQPIGRGTERLEEQLTHALPAARVARIDADSTRHKGALEAQLGAVHAGEVDVLVGTQMVAKGHDVAGVTLVGILSADFLLGMPDFRSAERTFQLITQAAGRAGRGEHAGRVIIQSFHPEHHAVEAASRHDFLSFYEKDIRYRKLVGYPPVQALARVELRHPDAAKAEAMAREAAGILREALGRAGRVTGPVDAPIPRLEGKYRKLVVLRSPARNALRAAVGALLRSPLGKRHVGRDLDAEIDPGSMM